MTPKEKAEELVDKFTLYLGTDVTGQEYYVNELDAKRCALIAVDEILQLCPLANRDYWEQVKQEIEKL